MILLSFKILEQVQMSSSKWLQRDLGYNNEVLSLSKISQEWLKILLQISKAYKSFNVTLGSYHQHFNAYSNSLPWKITMVYIAKKSISYPQVEWDLQIFDPQI